MSENFYTLITGSSEGFGRALAVECASRKMNLILVSLPDSGLDCLSEELKERFQVDVIIMETDLSVESNCISVYENVKDLDLKVNMLINNVGLGSTMFFNEGDISFYQKQLRLNVMVITVLTHLFRDMLRKNGPSHVLCVGSLCSFFYLIKKQVYGATKSYVYFFSKSLRREWSSENINVSVVCPGPMNTNAEVIWINVNNNWLTRMSTMEPEEVAPIAINGLLNKKEVIIPGAINRMLLILDMFVPSFLKTMITDWQMKNMRSVTVKGIKHQTVVVKNQI